MNISQSQSRIGGAILVFSLLFGIVIVLGTTAQAQYPNDRNAQDRDRSDSGDQNRRGRNWDQYGDYGGSSQLRQTALNAGYNEGIQQSRNDRNRSNRSDYHNLSIYQNATKDYSRRLGDRELYRRYFREAFESGYNGEGYPQGNRVADRRGNRDRNDTRDRNDNGNQNRRGRNWDSYGDYGGTFQLRQTALNAGYNEGIKQGRNDRNRRNANGYQRQSAYQKATKDYSSRLGDRELYRRYYQEAYENGYEAGVNGY
ncbi:MAG TPA: hypothetical protein VN920_07380 [Pyrinomonadaceae bacterium]|nr:hypothetical protein [Pyrinomonadaceae bacterium]